MKLQELYESFSQAQKDFEDADVPSVMTASYIRRFRILNRNQRLHGPEKDINFWRKKGFEEFKAFVDERWHTPSENQLNKKRTPGNQVHVFDTDDWSIDIALDSTAACNLGKGTGWCTGVRKTPYFDKLKRAGMVGLIHIKNKHSRDIRKQFAFVYEPPHEPEIYDGTDEQIQPDEFEENTGLSVQQILDKTAAALK